MHSTSQTASRYFRWANALRDTPRPSLNKNSTPGARKMIPVLYMLGIAISAGDDDSLSVKRLARLVGTAPNTVRGAIKEAVGQGLLTVTQRPGYASRYEIPGLSAPEPDAAPTLEERLERLEAQVEAIPSRVPTAAEIP